MNDDPWDWNDDRIVKEFCSEERSWEKSERQKLPPAGEFEKFIRENEVDGSTLLTELYEGSTLKDNLRINLNQYATLKYAIRTFRDRSTKYKAHHSVTQSVQTAAGTDKLISKFSYILENPDLYPELLAIFREEQHGLSGDNWIVDNTGKRRRLEVSTSTAVDKEASPAFEVPQYNLEEKINIPLLGLQGSSPIVLRDSIIDNPKKRRRIAPTLVTSVIDSIRDRSEPSAADHVVLNTVVNNESGIAFRRVDGKKRLVLFPQSHNDDDFAHRLHARLHSSSNTNDDLHKGGAEALLAANRIIQERQTRNKSATEPLSLHIGYLGKKRLKVDEVFYGNTKAGERLTEPCVGYEFHINRQLISSGRRIYINGLMKNYFSTPPCTFQRDGKSITTIQPYAKGLVEIRIEPSVTVFQSGGDAKVHASREDLSKWPEANGSPEGQSTRKDAASGARHEGNKSLMRLECPSSFDSWDPEKNLGKYLHIEGGDRVLPIYGESDSDNDYDLETWREIEKEKGKLEEPLMRSKKRRNPLSDEEFLSAIDDAISLHIIKWNAKKLPRLEAKAWQKWQKAYRRGTRRDEIRQMQGQLYNLALRIPKMLNEIKKSNSTINGVRKAAGILEQTIFDREENNWHIALLKRKKTPGKPVTGGVAKTNFKEIEAPVKGEEVIATESGSESSDDDMGDFIASEDDIQMEASSVDSDTEHPTSQDGDAVSADFSPVSTNNQDLAHQGLQFYDQAEEVTIKSEASALLLLPNLKKASSKGHPEVIDLISSSEVEFLPNRKHSVDSDIPEKKFKTPFSYLNEPRGIAAHEMDWTAGASNSFLNAIVVSDSDDLLPSVSDLEIMEGGRRQIPDASTQLSHPSISEEDSEDEPLVRKRLKQPSTTTEEEEEEDEEELDVAMETPRRIRKRKVAENAEARSIRDQDRMRLREQEERRKILHAKLAESSQDVDVDMDRMIINEAKTDDQGFIYFDKQIAKCIKPHQIEGVRFMWSQIVSGGDLAKGCLLSQTMGLGKTMQVITLLVAIAESVKSSDASIRMQIPENLQVQRILILCPPTIIDNWMDELLLWAPKDALGILRKIDGAATKTNSRQRVIEAWHEEHGILIMGYEMFRVLVQDVKADRSPSQYTNSRGTEVWNLLLDGANIVVADEAHKMKNEKAGLTIAARKFKNAARIALTGSPLANNLEEYYSMIDWVAPNYLGPIAEFRSKYVEPINQGLFKDSTPIEHRASLKMLGILTATLSPKVHRADMQDLIKNLPPKFEFVITVPLTELQSKLYSSYVRNVHSGPIATTEKGHVKQTTIWSWISILKLVCNHPACFDMKLNAMRTGRKKKMQKLEAVTSSGLDDGLACTNEDEERSQIVDDSISDSFINSVDEILHMAEPSFSLPEHSNKIRVLGQILDLSRAAGDKVLVFSLSLLSLNYLEQFCIDSGRKYGRLDGATKMTMRQEMTKDFNTGDTEVYLISTTAGGLGLNLFSANRVVIFDFGYNPVLEEQAVGRAFRIGQQKPVFVYRLLAGGTFEIIIHNTTIFKKQLADRVINKKAPLAYAEKNSGDLLFKPKEVQQEALHKFIGMDTKVLDEIIQTQSEHPTIRSIVKTDTFEVHDSRGLTAEDAKEIEQYAKEAIVKQKGLAAWNVRQLEPQAQTPLQSSQIPRSDLPHQFNSDVAKNTTICNHVFKPEQTRRASLPSNGFSEGEASSSSNITSPTENSRIEGWSQGGWVPVDRSPEPEQPRRGSLPANRPPRGGYTKRPVRNPNNEPVRPNGDPFSAGRR